MGILMVEGDEKSGALSSHKAMSAHKMNRADPNQTGFVWGVPSGKVTYNYGKSPFIVIFPMKNGDFA